MRCRHFTLRLTAPHAQDDEARLNDFLQHVQVHSVQTSAGAPGLWSVLIFYDETGAPARDQVRAAQVNTEPSQEPDLTAEQQRVYERLRDWRSQRASVEGKPAYVIAHNAVLKEIARRHMDLHAAEDLLGISQFGPARTTRYGPDIIALLTGLRSANAAVLFDNER